MKLSYVWAETFPRTSSQAGQFVRALAVRSIQIMNLHSAFVITKTRCVNKPELSKLIDSAGKN